LSYAATVTTGREWPDGDRIKPMNVLLFSAEDKRDTTIVPRLKAMGADLKRVEIVDCTRYRGREAVFSVARDLPLLERKLEENGEIGVVILDPIKSFLGEKADANDEIKLRNMLEPLARLAAKQRTAIIGVMDLKKGQEAVALHEFGGTGAFGAVARANYVCYRDKDDHDRRVFLSAGGNIGRHKKGFSYHVESENFQ